MRCVNTIPFFPQGIPGHLLLPILENLDPLEIEKLEVSSIFKAMSMLEKNVLLMELYTFKALCGIFLNTINFPVTDQLHESALWYIKLFNNFFYLFLSKK